MVAVVGDVEVAARIHRHVVGGVELGAGGQAAVAGEAGAAGAGYGGDVPGGQVHLADPVVVVVGDIDVVACVYRHAGGVGEVALVAATPSPL